MRGVLMLPTRRLQSSRAQAMLVSAVIQAAGSGWGFVAAVQFYHSCGPWKGSSHARWLGPPGNAQQWRQHVTGAVGTAGVVHISTLPSQCKMPADYLQALQH